MSRRQASRIGFVVPGRGVLPAGWRWLALKRCCQSIQRGMTPRYASTGIPLVNQASVQWDGIRWSAVRFHRGDKIPERAWLKAGDVLVNSTGRGTLGRAVLYRPSDDHGSRAVADSHISILRPSPWLDGRFLKYCLESRSYRHYVTSVLATGATKQQELSRDGLSRLPIPLPPIAEQRTLADRLDRLTAAIDRIIDQKEQLVALHEERFRVRAESILTGGVDGGQPTAADPATWTLPAGWQAMPLMHLVDPARPITYGVVQPGPPVAPPDGVVLIKGGHVDSTGLRIDPLTRISIEVAANYPRGELRRGDLVMAIRGSVGSVAEVPPALDGAMITQDVARIAPREGVDPRWLLVVLRSRIVQRQVELGLLGATVQGLNLRDLRRLIVPVPPTVDQRRLGRQLAAWRAPLGTLADKSRESCERLREYRSALLGAAVLGRLDRLEPVDASRLGAVAVG